MKYYSLILMLWIGIASCKIAKPFLQEKKQSSTIVEKVVDTTIQLSPDSSLSTYRVSIENNRLRLSPLFKFGSVFLRDTIYIDTTTQTLQVRTFRDSMPIKIQYKNIYRTDTLYEKIIQHITTNKLNAWQQFMNYSGYGLWILILLFIAYIVLKITQKIHFPL